MRRNGTWNCWPDRCNLDQFSTDLPLCWPCGSRHVRQFRQETLISSKVVAPGLGGLVLVAFLSWTDDFAQNQAQILGNDVKEDMPAWGTHQIMVDSVANQPIQFSTIENPSEPGTYGMYVVFEELLAKHVPVYLLPLDRPLWFNPPAAMNDSQCVNAVRLSSVNVAVHVDEFVISPEGTRKSGNVPSQS